MVDNLISAYTQVEPNWECFLLSVSLLKKLSCLPVHETCQSDLERVVIPRGQDTVKQIREELLRRNVCAVSWRWSKILPQTATLDAFKDWCPMSEHQFQQLLKLVEESQADYIWIDWSCIPQFSGDSMKFINASYEIYSLSPRVVFLPRLKPLKRRGWLSLSPEDTRAALSVVRNVAEKVISSGKFTTEFGKIVGHADRIERLEKQLAVSDGRNIELKKQIESVINILSRLLEGDEVVYPTFDYYGRAWTLAERLEVFNPSRETPIRLSEIHTAGDALLYGMSSFWRDVNKHSSANSRESRSSIDESDISFAVYVRGVESDDPDVLELWDDMNHMVQLAPGILGIASETSALAIICVEWLLHESIGASDELGKIAASLLGECAAYVSIAVASATMLESADGDWFRKYLHFQAGHVYNSTITKDLILAVYRSCGLQERATVDEAIEACLLEVFGEPSESAQVNGNLPQVDRLCREALRHEELHTHLWTRGQGEQFLSATDFAPLMPPARQNEKISLAAWHEWLMESGLIISWWFSRVDQTLDPDPTDCIDVEQLYCGDVTKLNGLSLDQIFDSTVSAVYKLHRLTDLKWQLLQLSLSRRGGKCSEGLSQYRVNQGLTLKGLLSQDVISNGYAEARLIGDWNQRFLNSLDEAVHNYWLQCIFSPDIFVVS